MNEEVLKSYEELKRNRNIINTIEPDFFFEIVDCLLKENEELKKFIIEGITIESNSPYKNYQLDFLRKNFIPRQNIKDKIRKNEEIIDISNDVDTIHELYQENKVYEELLESEE